MLLPVERDVVLGTGYKEPLALIEDLMAQLYPIEVVLRLLCLISLANQVWNQLKNLPKLSTIQKQK